MPTVDFQRQVLDRSYEIPVVVDFWADWCAPCRTLGPVLAELAAEAEGGWELVKVDTEAQPDLAQRYGVMSIPSVKMFHAGRVIAEFVGALPREEIYAWLSSNLPDPRLERLEELARGWEEHGAQIAPELERFAEEHPDLAAAKLRLALAVVGADPARARALLAEADPGIDQADLAEDISSLADLMELPAKLPEKVGPHLEAAREALRAHDLDLALESLVEAAMRDKRFGDELARRAAVSLFRALGQGHPLTRKHQRTLSMALHS